MSDCDFIIVGPGCLIGQHTESILAELGYSAQQVEDLLTRKVVFFSEDRPS